MGEESGGFFIMVGAACGMVGNLVGGRKEKSTVLEEGVARVEPQGVSRRVVLRVPRAVRQEAAQARRHQPARAVPLPEQPPWPIPVGRYSNTWPCSSASSRTYCSTRADPAELASLGARTQGAAAYSTCLCGLGMKTAGCFGPRLTEGARSFGCGRRRRNISTCCWKSRTR